MAIILEATYMKKLGLPGYSSHSYAVNVRTELQDLNQVEAASSRLYRLLQDAVDHDIQEVGFIPDEFTYGMDQKQPVNGHYNGNGKHYPVANGSNGKVKHLPATNGYRNNRQGTPITEKQLELVSRIVRDNNLDKNEIEDLAVDRFGIGVKQLNKMQASNLIDVLFERYPKRHQLETNRARR